MSDYAAEIKATIAKIAPDVELDAVDPAVPLVEQLDLDSMDYQTLLARLSARYGIDIPEADVPALRSIDDLASYLNVHAHGGSP